MAIWMKILLTLLSVIVFTEVLALHGAICYSEEEINKWTIGTTIIACILYVLIVLLQIVIWKV